MFFRQRRGGKKREKKQRDMTTFFLVPKWCLLNVPCSLATEGGVVSFIVKKKNEIGEKCLHDSLTIKLPQWSMGRIFQVLVLKVLPGYSGPPVTTLIFTSYVCFPPRLILYMMKRLAIARASHFSLLFCFSM